MHWIVKDRDWDLPVETFSDPESPLVRVKLPAIPLLKKQILLLSQKLDRLCYRKDGDTWEIPKETFATTAIAMGLNEDPEEGVRWCPVGYVIQNDNYQIKDKNNPLFYQLMVHAGIAKTNESAQFLWQRVCHHMLRWLLDGNKLDMQFASLDVLPYRVNWLDAIRQMHFARYKATVTYLNNRRRYGNISRMIRTFLLDESLFALQPRRGLIEHTLMITPRSSFAIALQNREEKRKERPFYLSNAIDTLRGHYESIVSCYYRYFNATCRPKLQVCYVPLEKRVDAVSKPEYALYPQDTEFPFLSVSSYTWSTKWPDSVKGNKDAEVNGVLPMPDLQSEGENVRDTGKSFIHHSWRQVKGNFST